MTDKSTAGRDGEAGSTGFARVSIEAPRIDAATGLLGKEAFFDEAAAYLRHSGARDVSIVCFDVDISNCSTICTDLIAATSF